MPEIVVVAVRATDLVLAFFCKNRHDGITSPPPGFAEIMSIILEAYFRSNMPHDLNGDELVDLCVSCIVKNGYDTKQSLLSDRAFIKYDVLGLKNVKEGGLPHRFVMTIYKTIEDLDKELLPSANSNKEKEKGNTPPKVLTVYDMSCSIS